MTYNFSKSYPNVQDAGVRGNLGDFCQRSPMIGPLSAEVDNRRGELSLMVSRGPPLEGGLGVDSSDSGSVSVFGAILNPKGRFSRSGNEQEPQG